MSGMINVDNLSFEPGRFNQEGLGSGISQEETKQLLSIVAAPVAAAILAPTLGSVYGAITGHRLYKAFGVYKRPALSFGVYRQMRGAKTAMRISKGYAKVMLGVGLYGLGTNVALARAREYKRLGINVIGPPGSLFLYDRHMGRNKITEDVKMAAEEESRIDASLTSVSKTRGKRNSMPKQYKPLRGMKCRPGYKFVSVPGSEVGMCVKQ